MPYKYAPHTASRPTPPTLSISSPRLYATRDSARPVCELFEPRPIRLQDASNFQAVELSRTHSPASSFTEARRTRSQDGLYHWLVDNSKADRCPRKCRPRRHRGTSNITWLQADGAFVLLCNDCGARKENSKHTIVERWRRAELRQFLVKMEEKLAARGWRCDQELSNHNAHDGQLHSKQDICDGLSRYVDWLEARSALFEPLQQRNAYLEALVVELQPRNARLEVGDDHVDRRKKRKSSGVVDDANRRWRGSSSFQRPSSTHSPSPSST